MSEVPDTPRRHADALNGGANGATNGVTNGAANGAANGGTEPELELPDVRSGADLRCSDVDRERVAEALRQAASDGRLTLTELEERLDTTFRARTYGDLQPITRDLPQGPYPVPGTDRSARWASRAGGAPPAANTGAGATPAPATSGQPTPHADPRASERITTVLTSDKRKGRWEVPQRLDVVNVLGTVVLDFTEAIVRSPEVDIHIGLVLGNVTIIVPDGIDVRVSDVANVLGERKVKLNTDSTPGAPVYRLRGFVLLGEITVRPPRKSLGQILDR